MRIVKLALTVFLTGGEVTIFFLLTHVKLNVGLYYKATMILFKHSEDLRTHLQRVKDQNFSIGFVPTMGALHNGHLSLISKSKKKADVTVCSIFVNPVQFNNIEDFKKYPLSIEKDILLLEESGCDILFMPSEQEIYPDAASKNKRYDLGSLEEVLEGKFRPGHFQGVCLVVEKLLNIVEPGYLFLGQKDYQQCLIIKRLGKIMGKKIKVFVCPILREKNGLAMSSRNLRLNEEEKKLAAQLYKSLNYIKNNLQHENFPELRNKTIKSLEKKGFKVDYLELAKSKNLELIEKYKKVDNLIILIAAYLNGVRLIDNVLVKDLC